MGEFSVIGGPTERSLESNNDGLAFTGEMTNGSGKRIDPTEVVEHGSTDAVFRQRLDFEAAFGIEAVDGLDKADGSSGHQIIQFDEVWAAPVDSGCDETDLRHVVQNELVTISHFEGSLGESLEATSAQGSGTARARSGQDRASSPAQAES